MSKPAVSKPTTTITFRIELARTLPSGKSYTLYVCEQRTSWDGGWNTPHIEKAKTWKTAAGAQRWLTERPEIAGTVVQVPDYRAEMRERLAAMRR